MEKQPVRRGQTEGQDGRADRWTDRRQQKVSGHPLGSCPLLSPNLNLSAILIFLKSHSKNCWLPGRSGDSQPLLSRNKSGNVQPFPPGTQCFPQGSGTSQPLLPSNRSLEMVMSPWKEAGAIHSLTHPVLLSENLPRSGNRQLFSHSTSCFHSIPVISPKIPFFANALSFPSSSVDYARRHTSGTLELKLGSSDGNSQT